MCGISGTLRHSSDGPAVIQNLIHDQTRRGPDHSEWRALEAGSLHLTFGHNRLAILDLDPRSNQPFIDKASQQILVYNGEIYNYLELRNDLERLGATFSTTSDTEVLLKAYQQWDVEAFSRFNGMFAFALYDPALKRTLMVRDRYGVKPLYYHLANGKLTFASSPVALAKRVDTSINYSYLERGARANLFDGLSDETAFKGIYAAPPGKCLIFEGEQLNHVRYYALTERVQSLAARLVGQSLEENVKELERLLLSAVELRLRADVPTTLSLSGGLDSGLCAALIREVKEGPFEAFTFANADMPGSEASLAAVTAKHLGIKLNYVVPHADGVVSRFEDTLTAQGAPFGHISGLAQNAIFAAINQAKYKVSIGGQGADEGFAGYRKFQLSALKELYADRDLTQMARQGWGTARTLFGEWRSPQNYLYNFKRMHVGSERSFLRKSLCPSTEMPHLPNRTLQDRQIADVQALSLPTLLRYEDCNSMFHSIESRMPFLDYRVMEFGLALPLEHKIHSGFGKFILRRLSEPRLPPEIVWDRSKRAFSLKSQWWLRQGLSDSICQHVQRNKKSLRDLLSDATYEQIGSPRFYDDPENFTKMTTLLWLSRQSPNWRGAKS